MKRSTKDLPSRPYGIGVIQLLMGGAVYFRIDQQVETLQSLYHNDRQAFLQNETNRMDGVMKNFSMFKKIQIGFVVAGLLLIVRIPSKPFWFGMGRAMLLQ